MNYSFNLFTKFSFRYQTAIFFVSIVYAGVLAGFPVDVFKDRDNYLAYAVSSIDIFKYYQDQGVLAVFANEPVWLFLNAGLSIFFKPEEVVSILVFFPALIVSFLVLKSSPRNFIYLLLFLLSPQVIKNHIIHLRQGVAVAVFLVGWFSKNKSRRIVLFLVASLIHSSFFFVGVFIFLNWLIRRLKLANDLSYIAYLSVGVSIGLGLGFLAEFLGSRKAQEYSFSMAEVSGLGFVFWLGVLGIYILEGKRFVGDNRLPIGIIIFYLSTYFFIEITARVFESVIVLVFLSGLYLTNWRRTIFLIAFFSYGFISYYLKLHEPWLGWGG